MTVGSINSNMNAVSYPQQLPDKVKKGNILGLAGAGLALGEGALEFTNNPVVKKYPWLTLGASIIGTLMAVFGFGSAIKAQHELNKHVAGLKVDA